MANQLSTLSTLTNGASFTAPLSPAEKLFVVTGHDAEGWPEYLLVSVGDLVTNPGGRHYRVIGFTLANTVIAVQSGLDIDPDIAHVELLGDKMEHASEAICSSDVLV
jgi:hypothetical protein